MSKTVSIKDEIRPPVVVLVDVGNTLLEFDKTRAYARLAKLYDFPTEEIEEFVKAEIEESFEKGELTGEEFVERLAARFNKTHSLGEVKLAWSDIFTKLRVTLLKELVKCAESGSVVLVLCSDTDPWRQAAIEKKLERYIYHFVFPMWSHKLRKRKRDGGFFTEVTDDLMGKIQKKKKLPRRPKQFLLLDDLPENRQMAEKAGLCVIDSVSEKAATDGFSKQMETFGDSRPIEPSSRVLHLSFFQELDEAKAKLRGFTDGERLLMELLDRSSMSPNDRQYVLAGEGGRRKPHARTLEKLRAFTTSIRAEIDRQSPRQDFGNSEMLVKKNRGAITSLLAAHYKEQYEKEAAFFGHPERPLIARVGWLPERLIPLQEIDQSRLLWVNRAPQPIGYPFRPLFEERRALLASGRTEDELAGITRNDDTFRLVKIGNPSSKNDAPTFTFTLSDYQAYTDTCEALLWEAAEVFGNEAGVDPRAAIARCRLRQKFVPDIFNLENRDCAVGVSTLCVMVDSEQPSKWLLHIRQNTLEAMNTCHVMPAGSFQPFLQFDMDHEFEMQFMATVFREFCEECLCEESEMHRLRRNKTQAFTMAELYRQAALLPRSSKAFQQFFDGSLARNFFLGIGIDVATTKPEILTLLLVNRARFRKITGLDSATTNLEGNWIYQNFSQEDLRRFLDNPGSPKLPPFLSAGAACLSRTLDLWPQVEAAIQEFKQ